MIIKWRNSESFYVKGSDRFLKDNFAQIAITIFFCHLWNRFQSVPRQHVSLIEHDWMILVEGLLGYVCVSWNGASRLAVSFYIDRSTMARREIGKVCELRMRDEQEFASLQTQWMREQCYSGCKQSHLVVIHSIIFLLFSNT